MSAYPGTWEAEAGGPNFEVSLGYKVRPCLKRLNPALLRPPINVAFGVGSGHLVFGKPSR
jgi:hypothetical protein